MEISDECNICGKSISSGKPHVEIELYPHGSPPYNWIHKPCAKNHLKH